MDIIGRFSADGAIDLALVADFTLGELRVRPSMRRVGEGARELVVEPRVMQALIALASADGAVVSRDALIERCWGGRIVGDDAINRCIAKVRRLAEVTAPPAFGIETVPKVGYALRTLSPDLQAYPDLQASPDLQANPGLRADKDLQAKPGVAALESGLAMAPTPPPIPALAPVSRWAGPGSKLLPLFRSRVLLAFGGFLPGPAMRWLGFILVAGTALAASWMALRAPAGTQRWGVQSSRKIPRVQSDFEPAISPDGKTLAYVSGALGLPGRVFVRNIEGGTPAAISAPGEDANFPAWSADGRKLAYVVIAGADQPCRIMVATMPGGTARLAGHCHQASATTLDWQPGTDNLFLVDNLPLLDGQTTGFFKAVFRLDTVSGRSEQVTSPQTTEDDWSPHASPDGQWVAYISGHGLAGQVIKLRRLSSSEERELPCEASVISIAWTPDSRTILADLPSHTGSKILAQPVDGTAGYTLYSSPSILEDLATGPDGRLAIAMSDFRSNLARAHATPRAGPEIIDPAAGETDWPAYAPDGTLAFASTRSGEMAVWVRKPGQPPALLVALGDKDLRRLSWSPQGDRLAFVTLLRGEIIVHVVNRRGEETVSFAIPSIGFGMPSWAPDGRHLLYFDKRILKTVRVDLQHTDQREPVSDVLQDNITFYKGGEYSTNGILPGLWQLQPVRHFITAHYPPLREARMAFRGEDILIPENDNAGTLRIHAQPLAGGPDRIAYYAPDAEDATPLAVDPLTGDVIYVSAVYANADINLLTLTQH